MSRIAVAILGAGLAAAAIGQERNPARQSDALTTRLERTLLGIQTANRYDLASRVQAFAELAEAHDVLPLLLARYETAPREDYSSRRFLLGVIGELQDSRALDLLVKVLSTRLPRGEGDSERFDTRAEEETVLVKAVHAVGYMRTVQARELLLRTMREHESHFVRAEAVATYLWNSKDRSTATQELLRVLPESLRPVVTMPLFHRNMDRQAFERALAEWRQQWSQKEYVVFALMLLCVPRGGETKICELDEGSNSDQRARELLFSRHQCQPLTLNLVRRGYTFKERHWDQGWGWDDCSANDSRFAFPRIVDAAYVLLRGIDQPDNNGGWHRSADYARVPRGEVPGDRTRRHAYQHEPEYDDDSAMRSFRGLFRTDRVEIECPGFDSSPMDIASFLLHEAEHIILGSWRGTLRHKRSERCTGECADRWHRHPVPDPSAPYEIRSTHSMYQIQVEFLCDLSTFPAGWVTADINERAAITANSYLDYNFLNPPGWRCSEPRPAPWPEVVKLRATEVERF